MPADQKILTAPLQPTSAPPRPYFADVYTFAWPKLCYRIPSVCSISVGLCLILGVLVGHPSAGLIAGGGAMTIGFGVNQHTRLPHRGSVVTRAATSPTIKAWVVRREVAPSLLKEISASSRLPDKNPYQHC